MRGWRLALRAAAGLVFGFMLLPLLLVSWLAFTSNAIPVFPPEGYTLRWFAVIWQQGQFVDGFVLSLQVAVLATIGGLALGLPASFALTRHRLIGREGVNTLMLLPLVVPNIVIGTALYIYFVEVEVATGLPLTASLPGLVAAHVLITIPWVVKLLTASLIGLDQTIEEAAASLGADPWRRLRLVTLPLIRPGMVAAALFGFVVSFGNLEMTLFLAGPGRQTLPVAILQYLEWKLDPSVAAVSVVQIAVVAIGMLTIDRFVRLSRVI